jgi:hypothetical protein
MDSYGIMLSYAKTKNKVFSLNFIIHRQKCRLSVYWNMRSSLSAPIKKKGNTVIYLHIQKIYDWWPMRSQNSAKHLWLSANVGPTFKKNTYHWLFMRSHFSTRIFTTDDLCRMDIQKEYWWLTTQVGSMCNKNTDKWLSMWVQSSTWTLMIDRPYGTYVQHDHLQLTDHVVPVFNKNTYDWLSVWEQCSTRESWKTCHLQASYCILYGK